MTSDNIERAELNVANIITSACKEITKFSTGSGIDNNVGLSDLDPVPNIESMLSENVTSKVAAHKLSSALRGLVQSSSLTREVTVPHNQEQQSEHYKQQVDILIEREERWSEERKSLVLELKVLEAGGDSGVRITELQEVIHS